MTTIYRLSLLVARSLAAAAVGFVATWAMVLAFLAIFGGNVASFVLETAGTIQTVLASQILLMGVPLSWSMPAFHVHATVTPMALLQDTPALLLGGLVPLGGSIVAGLMASWWARHLGQSRVVAIEATAVLFALGAGVAALALPHMSTSPQAIRFEAVPIVVGAAALPWGLVGGLFGAWLDSRLLTLCRQGIGRPAHWTPLGKRSVISAGLAFVIVNVVPTSIPTAAAAPAMGLSTLPLPVATRPAVLSALHQLDREPSTSSSAVIDPSKGTASFVRPHSSLGRDEQTWLQNHTGLFGVQDLSHSLKQTRKGRDSLGATHAYFDQTYGGVPVYGATVSVHTGRDATLVDAVSSSLVPDVPSVITTSLMTTEAAVLAAKRALPDGELVKQPTLYVFVHSGSGPAGTNSSRQSSLVWVVWLAAAAHDVSKAYFVDARSSAGIILHTEDRAESFTGRNRSVYDLNHGSILPGTAARAEGQAASPVTDVNKAYDNTGSTYDYYLATFGRNSYDNQGATLISSVRYRDFFLFPYLNAQWNGYQMVYGDGMATLDITGHELTHAVTGATANLAYQNQSGALNESFSDIFGEMVELYATGTNDWLLGEGSAAGVSRSMKDPTQGKQPGSDGWQPDNFHNYVTDCGDNGGVHINSGIQNKAFYNIAQSIGADKAAAVFYRALTMYLSAGASFEDSRAATIAAASFLYDTNVTLSVATGWNAVGVDGTYQAPAQNCGGGGSACFAQAALNATSLTGPNVDGPAQAEILATLYEIRDEVAPNSLAGSHYLGVWDKNTAEAAQLIVSNKSVRRQAARVFQTLTPGLKALASGNGRRVVVSKHLVDEINDLLDSLTIADRGGRLVTALSRERARVDFTRLEGHSFADAVSNVSVQLMAAGVTVSSSN